MTGRLNAGMVGGGRDAFIGGVHRMAMRLDGKIELVAGAFSSNPEKAKLSGEDLLLDAQRVYADYRTMAAEESRLPSGERIDFVSVVTPNRTHVPVAKTFLEAGINVVCDKPLAFNLEEARALRDVVRRTGKLFALTHNYTGYPMVKEARELVRNGELGEILKVVAEYPQGWLLKPIDEEGQKQASWRTDPQQAGVSGCIGDIGTHAENLSRYIAGLQIGELCHMIGRHPLEPVKDAGTIKGQPAHVADVEEPHTLTHRLMLVDDRRVLDRHRPTAKFNQAAAAGLVPVVEWRLQ